MPIIVNTIVNNDVSGKVETEIDIYCHCQLNFQKLAEVADETVWLMASGLERDAILEQMSNLPYVKDTPFNTFTIWRGDHARFIADNLKNSYET